MLYQQILFDFILKLQWEFNTFLQLAQNLTSGQQAKLFFVVSVDCIFVVAGMYFVDPNQGSPKDAIQVYCDMPAQRTCVLAQPDSVRCNDDALR